MHRRLSIFIFLVYISGAAGLQAQGVRLDLVADTGKIYQEIAGFGGSLAYYENWVTAHPNKAGIYDALFAELGINILRVRNAHVYDPTMIYRVDEFVDEAYKATGLHIRLLVTSWGPPASLKNNNDTKNGGTIRYEVDSTGKVVFDYNAFAGWWYSSLDEYNGFGIFPAYISIQNEPDFTATWESCRLSPNPTVTALDTIAGYNEALKAVYDSIRNRTKAPQIIGPECIGIGYNAVENYVNALDTSKITAIAHHLYHGVNEDYPWDESTFKKVGDFMPAIPHFQTEYSRGETWFNLSAFIYKALNDESAAAYLYWDLAWPDAGLISIENPWTPGSWNFADGYSPRKHFYVFKQFSAFITPGWRRIQISPSNAELKSLAFISPDMDSATVVVINRSADKDYDLHLGIPGFKVTRSTIFKTSGSANCKRSGSLEDSVMTVEPTSIATVIMKLAEYVDTGSGPVDTGSEPVDTNTAVYPVTSGIFSGSPRVYPNPFSESSTLEFSLKSGQEMLLCIYDLNGKMIRQRSLGRLEIGMNKISLPGNGLRRGVYFYTLSAQGNTSYRGKLLIR